MRTTSLGLLAASMILALAAAGQAPSPAKMDELMHRSGVWDQATGLSANLIAPGKDEDKLDPALQARARAARQAGYSADILRTRMRAYLAKHLAAPDVDAALHWLDGDVGRTMTRLEIEESNSKPADAAAAQRLFAVISDNRRGRVERMTKYYGSGEAGVKTRIDVALASAQVFATASGKSSEYDELKRKLESERPAMVQRAYEQALVNYNYLYRSLSLGELDRYLEFAESPAGQRYGAAMRGAIHDALVAGSTDVAQYIVKTKDSPK